MILVTVGNYRAFPRLVGAVDHLKLHGDIEDDVLLQIGNAEYKSEICQVRHFLSPEEFQRNLQKATVIITHGGGGTLIQALRANKVPVVMPRRKKYDEAIDDHQIELAEAFARDGRVIVAYEAEELPAAVAEARQHPAHPNVLAPPRMTALVSRAIEELLTHRPRRLIPPRLI